MEADNGDDDDNDDDDDDGFNNNTPETNLNKLLYIKWLAMH